MAAAILMLAGYDPGAPLIDPMCGSGTFSLEAAMMAANIPAGWFRDFAFMDWPAFRPEKWRHIRRAVQKTIIPAKSPVIFASDIDGAAVQKLSETVHSRHLSTAVRVRKMDFFALMPRDIEVSSGVPEKTGLLVLNPPYGRRLGSWKAAETSVGRICNKLKSDFKGWHVALLLPDQDLLSKIPFPVTTRQLSHGGLKITLATGFIF
jgi:putative N6-adenine-specific DNA methylase